MRCFSLCRRCMRRNQALGGNGALCFRWSSSNRAQSSSYFYQARFYVEYRVNNWNISGYQSSSSISTFLSEWISWILIMLSSMIVWLFLSLWDVSFFVIKDCRFLNISLGLAIYVKVLHRLLIMSKPSDWPYLSVY